MNTEDALLHEQFKRCGYSIEWAKVINRVFDDPTAWLRNLHWPSERKRGRFRKWAVRQIMKREGLTRERAEREYNHWDLCYGLSTREELEEARGS